MLVGYLTEVKKSGIRVTVHIAEVSCVIDIS